MEGTEHQQVMTSLGSVGSTMQQQHQSQTLTLASIKEIGTQGHRQTKENCVRLEDLIQATQTDLREARSDVSSQLHDQSRRMSMQRDLLVKIFLLVGIMFVHLQTMLVLMKALPAQIAALAHVLEEIPARIYNNRLVCIIDALGRDFLFDTRAIWTWHVCISNDSTSVSITRLLRAYSGFDQLLDKQLCRPSRPCAGPPRVLHPQ